MKMNELLEATLTRKGSDLHLLVGVPPMVKVNSILAPIAGEPSLTQEDIEGLIFTLMSDEQKEMLKTNKEIDFSYAYQEKARFRINAYHEKGHIAAALRLLPWRIPVIDELNLPPICHVLTRLRQGLILVTGPTGHGKSTSLAAIIGEINDHRALHIVTIEDPLEYLHTPKKSILSQREIRSDTHSWQIALRSCLREDPDVVLIGEMRDYETIAAALTIAETGHLVFATLHTNSASQTIDRVVDVFPENQQAQVRMQLANTLEAILSQRLIPSTSGSLLPAVEILVATNAVRTSIREGKSHLIDNVIQTSAELGMQTLEMDLARLVRQGKISLEVAKSYALRPEDLMRLIRK